MNRARYDELTWIEMREALALQPVVLLPVGAVEDHGPHLPLNTDNIIVEAICLEAARRLPGEALVMPPVAYGLDEHHMDFPGTISIAENGEMVRGIEYGDLQNTLTSMLLQGSKK